MRPDEVLRRDLAAGLATLVRSWRKPKASDVRPVVQSLAIALRAEKDPERRGRLAWALAPLAERLSPEESMRICLAAAESLSSDWWWMGENGPDDEWIRALVVMVIRWPMAIAAGTARLIATVMPLSTRQCGNWTSYRSSSTAWTRAMPHGPLECS